MQLTVQRITKPTNPNYTIGKLYIDGKHFCDTLEPENRLARGEKKVHGKTAIPAGTYSLTLTYSNRFGAQAFYKEVSGGKLPLVNNVPDFAGVRIHTGNTASSTEGCLLVGRNLQKGTVLYSREAYRKLMAELLPVFARGESVTITYKN